MCHSGYVYCFPFKTLSSFHFLPETIVFQIRTTATAVIQLRILMEILMVIPNVSMMNYSISLKTSVVIVLVGLILAVTLDPLLIM